MRKQQNFNSVIQGIQKKGPIVPLPRKELELNDIGVSRPKNLHNGIKTSRRFPKELFIPTKTSKKIVKDEIISLKGIRMEGPTFEANSLSVKAMITKPKQTIASLKEKQKSYFENPEKPSGGRSNNGNELGNFTTRLGNNQLTTLDLAPHPKVVKVAPPRVTIDLRNFDKIAISGQNQLKGKIMVKGKKPIRLKPIKRTVHSSQGGTIKILLPQDFIAGKTRPSSKDDEITKIKLIHTITRDPTNAHSSYAPSTSTSIFSIRKSS